MWITLMACFACFLIGGYAGLCLGYYSGTEVVRQEVRELLDRRWPIAEGQSAVIQDNGGAFSAN
jgi:hypothetical protein